MQGIERGTLAVISGPSGSGKTSICRMLAGYEGVHFSVSATTRRPRQGEEERGAYYFMTEEAFLEKRDKGEFLEWARYNDHYYGTPKDRVDEALAKGKKVILEIEVQGAARLRSDKVEGTYIFIVPPALDILIERLKGRGTESDEEVSRRVEIAKAEWKRAEEESIYDYFVVNDHLDRAVKETASILGLSEPKEGE